MSHNAAFDASIPVLTEVLSEPALANVPAESTPAKPEHRAQVPPPPARVLDEPLEAQVAVAAPEPDWDALEQRLAERILGQLQDRVEAALEQRLREGMTDVMQYALTALAAEVRASLRQTVEEAVAQEVSDLRILP